MKKERQPLTKREKTLLGLFIIGAGAAGYFAYGYFRSLKIADRLSDELGETIKENYALYSFKDDMEVMKHIISESDIIPNALQNSSNKISRVQNKIADTLTQIEKYPNDITLQKALGKHESRLAELLYKHTKAEELYRIIEEDNITYM